MAREAVPRQERPLPQEVRKAIMRLDSNRQYLILFDGRLGELLQSLKDDETFQEKYAAAINTADVSFNDRDAQIQETIDLQAELERNYLAPAKSIEGKAADATPAEGDRLATIWDVIHKTTEADELFNNVDNLTQGHIEAFNSKKKEILEQALKARSRIQELQKYSNKLKAARTRLERMKNPESIQGEAIGKALEKIQADDIAAINSQEYKHQKGLAKAIQKYQRAAAPRYLLGAAAAMASAMIPGMGWLGPVLRGGLGFMGSASMASTGAAQYMESKATRLLNRLNSASDQPLKTSEETKRLVQEYLGDAKGQILEDRLNELMEAYASLTHSAASQGLLIDTQKLEEDEEEERKRAQKGPTAADDIRRFYASGSTWNKVAKGAATAGVLALTAVGLGAISVATWPVALAGAALSYVRSNPGAYRRKAYRHTPLVQGLQEGVREFLKGHADQEEAVNRYFNQKSINDKRAQLAEGQRRKSIIAGTAMMTASLFFGAELHAHAEGAPASSHGAVPDTAHATASHSAAPEGGVATSHETHQGTGDAGGQSPTAHTEGGSSPVATTETAHASNPAEAAPATGIENQAEKIPTTLHLDDVGAEHRLMNDIYAHREATDPAFRAMDDAQKAHQVTEEFFAEWKGIQPKDHLDRLEIEKEILNGWSGRQDHTLDPNALLHHEEGGADSRLANEVVKGYMAQHHLNLTEDQQDLIRVKLVEDWHASDRPHFFADSKEGYGALVDDETMRSHLVHGSQGGIDAEKDMQEALQTFHLPLQGTAPNGQGAGSPPIDPSTGIPQHPGAAPGTPSAPPAGTDPSHGSPDPSDPSLPIHQPPTGVYHPGDIPTQDQIHAWLDGIRRTESLPTAPYHIKPEEAEAVDETFGKFVSIVRQGIHAPSELVQKLKDLDEALSHEDNWNAVPLQDRGRLMKVWVDNHFDDILKRWPADKDAVRSAIAARIGSVLDMVQQKQNSTSH